MKLQDHEHYLFLIWFVVTGLIVFGVVVAWQEGLIAQLLAGDRSHICLVIALVYVLASIHCAGRVIFLSTELNGAAQSVARIATIGSGRITRRDDQLYVAGEALRTCVLTEHLLDVHSASFNATAGENNYEQNNLTEALAERLKGAHELGWFVVDILLKLGLVGTIIGFILMLGSVANTASLDVNTMQKVLRQMSSGMGTALFTTLAGLIASILLGLQYLLLDKGADELLHRVIRAAEVDVISSLNGSQ